MNLYLLGLCSGVIAVFLLQWKLKHTKRGHQKQDLLTEGEERMIGLINNTKASIYYLEIKPKPKFLYTYPSFEAFLGEEEGTKAYEHPELLYERVHPDDYEMTQRNLRGQINQSEALVFRWALTQEDYENDKFRLFEVHSVPVYRDGKLTAIQGIVRDITEKKELERQLAFRMTHDTLTGVYNRYYFEEQFENYNSREDKAIAIVIIDLDDLKFYNDTCGHHKGDILLKEASRLIHAYSNEQRRVHRIGGDEFAILLIGEAAAGAGALVEDLKRDIMEYNKHSGDLKINMSIGYAEKESSIGLMKLLFVEADSNMYENKFGKKRSSAG